MSNVVRARGDREEEELGCAVSIVNRGIFAIRQAYLVRYRGDRCFIRFPNDTEMVLPSYPTMVCMCICRRRSWVLGRVFTVWAWSCIRTGPILAVVEQDHQAKMIETRN